MPRPGSAVPAGFLEFMPTRRDRVSAEILRQLKSAILAGRLKSGDRLPSEKQLAEQFQSSRGSVREAIRTLEQAGLLVVRRGAGGGAVVADGDLRHVTDSLFTLIRLGSVSIHDLTEGRVILEPRPDPIPRGGRRWPSPCPRSARRTSRACAPRWST